MRVIDLSHPLTNNTPVYPGDPPFALTPLRTMPQDDYTLYHLATALHAGTHIDAPMHMTPDTRAIGDWPLDSFWGRGVMLDVTGQTDITAQKETLAGVGAGDIVLLYTGHSRLYATDPQSYFAEHPVLSYALAERLAAKKIRMLGMDLPAPDRPPFPVHTLMLSHDIFLLENLTNLEALLHTPLFYVAAFPLRIRAEASVTRAAAVIP